MVHCLHCYSLKYNAREGMYTVANFQNLFSNLFGARLTRMPRTFLNSFRSMSLSWLNCWITNIFMDVGQFLGI